MCRRRWGAVGSAREVVVRRSGWLTLRVAHPRRRRVPRAHLIAWQSSCKGREALSVVVNKLDVACTARDSVGPSSSSHRKSVSHLSESRTSQQGVRSTRRGARSLDLHQPPPPTADPSRTQAPRRLARTRSLSDPTRRRHTIKLTLVQTRHAWLMTRRTRAVQAHEGQWRSLGGRGRDRGAATATRRRGEVEGVGGVILEAERVELWVG